MSRARAPSGPATAGAFAASAAILLAVAIGFTVSSGDGRVLELFVLGAGMLLAYVVEWRIVGLVVVALTTTFVLLEAHYGRIDGDHAASFVFFALLFAAAAAAGSYLGETFGAWNRAPSPGVKEAAEGTEEIAPIRPEPPPVPEAPLEAAVAAALADEGRLSLLVARFDDVEEISSVYGPRSTRLLLDHIASVLAKQLRPSDRLLRQEPFDFWVILPRTPLEVARIRAERMRLATAEERVSLGPEQQVAATISIGIAASPADASDWQTLLASAERALAGAVSLGGNRTVLHTLPPGAPRGWGLPPDSQHARGRAARS